MTRDEILTMEAGREMDCIIAENVFGWKRGKYFDDAGQLVWITPSNQFYSAGSTPDYSTDMTAAWQVVEKLSKPHIFINLSKFGDKYVCDIENMEDYSNPEKQFNRWKIDFCNSPALAICRAALLMTIGGEE